jgi:hypothetical protein
MNNNRLSTTLSEGDKIVDRTQLLMEIEELLTRPTNYEYRDDGRIFIISEQRFLTQGGGSRKGVELLYPDGTLIQIFKADCAKFLGLGKQTISSKLQKGEGVKYNNQLCILRNV